MMMMSANLIVGIVLLFGTPAAQEPAAPAAAPAAVTVPDTPAGRGLKEFIASFNAGGEKRREWVEARTTVDKETAKNILEQDAAFLEEHGAMTIVRLPQASPTTIEAVVRHAKTGAHGHLTLDVETATPHRISNMRLRAATPDEIKGPAKG